MPTSICPQSYGCVTKFIILNTWKSSNHSTSQDIPCLLWILNVIMLSIATTGPALCQMNHHICTEVFQLFPSLQDFWKIVCSFLICLPVVTFLICLNFHDLITQLIFGKDLWYATCHHTQRWKATPHWLNVFQAYTNNNFSTYINTCKS
jgi:hypothetical protein